VHKHHFWLLPVALFDGVKELPCGTGGAVTLPEGAVVVPVRFVLERLEE
jgi:hypothetical protein